MGAEDGLGIGLRFFVVEHYRPHSSPDPFGATLPPGEGIFSPRWGEGKNAKIPRFRRNGGFPLQFVRHYTPSVSQRPVGRFYSMTSPHNPKARIGTGPASRAVLLDFRQAESVRPEFGSRHCRATGRAVLLDFRQVKSIRHEFVRGDSPHYMSKGSMPRTGWPFSDR